MPAGLWITRRVAPVSDPNTALRALTEHPRVQAASERARAACTELRWHQALRRRIPEAAAESRIRGAWASAELDGARSTVDIVRDLMRGARARATDPDPTERIIHGAMAATAETEALAATALTSPRQTLARLHLAAAAELVAPDQLGRPRTSPTSPEFADLGPAPGPEAIAERLAQLDHILTSDAPALLKLALAHAEIAHVRPFERGNGLVARALDRTLLRATGLDPTGVVVPEAGHGAKGSVAYQGGLQAYGLGRLDGLLLWLDHCADAVVAGAGEGRRIADAVLAGRLT